MENTILSCIKERRSIRKYIGEQISNDQLGAILEAATWAPSGMNNQSWLFTAIQNQAYLKELNGLVRKGIQGLGPEREAFKKVAASDNYCFYYSAPTLIVASNVGGYSNAMVDCAAALENMLLAAHSLDIGGCWVNQLRWLEDDEEVRSFLLQFGIPKEHVICGAAAIGYIDGQSPAPAARKENTIRIIK